MLIRTGTEIPSSEITTQSLYLRRRELLAGVGGALAAGSIGGSLFGATPASAAPLQRVKGPFGTDEAQTPMQDATTYNNFYEFGLDKGDPARNSGSLQTQPWSIAVEGACNKPGVYQLEDLLKDAKLEDRIYRMRCVEAWSMVIPWVGFPLSDLLQKAEPTSAAKFVAFETLLAPNQMPGQKSRVLDWPYREGLRIDEAMHPLVILAVGMYGETLPKQNGAPLRLVVPWKYGFKGIKSIVKIRFQETQPKTAWNISAPGEYGFYSNVNPAVDHPRWSQARERRIGEFRKRETLPFNGYAEQVAGLYSGMDLKANF